MISRSTDNIIPARPGVAYNRRAGEWMVSYAINGAEIHSVIYKPDGAPAGDRASVNAAPPVLGTFYTPVTASTDAAEYLVVMVKNWNWIAGTVFASDKALP